MGGLAGLSGGYGLQSWMQAFDRSASAVVSASSLPLNDSAEASTGEAADLVDGLVGSDLAAEGVKASIAVLCAADEMLGTVIDLRA